MYSEVRQKADLLVKQCDPAMLTGRNIGLEKESLRVSADGRISQQDHPQSLGQALTHPFITTDFSEALLEMVTPPCASASEAIGYLNSIHQFIVARLPAGEHIWNTSMPCILHGAQSVRIGEYGQSHSGQMKHAYRRGLGLRYGKRMQAIAGVHFNFSLPEPAWIARQQLNASAPELGHFDTQWQKLSAVEQQRAQTDGYFQTMQNLLRIGWIVPYLFGASPAICTSFLQEGEAEDLHELNTHTRYAPHGTSLRMGTIGYRYREDQPIDLSVRHTDVTSYIEDIIAHVSSEHPAYKSLGLLDEDGNYQQLSTSRLQIENEFYSSVRPKQIADSGELPIHALKQRGIRYLELRSVDVNLLHPNGLELEQIAMLELLMLFAWLSTPVALERDELDACSRNVKTVAHFGRQPGLELQTANGKVGLKDWGLQIVQTLQPIAQWLDSANDGALYTRSLEQQRKKFENPDLTPSAQLLKGIHEAGSFFEHAQTLSRQHHELFKSQTIDEAIESRLSHEVSESISKQQSMEKNSQGRFEDFLDAYLSQIHSE